MATSVESTIRPITQLTARRRLVAAGIALALAVAAGGGATWLLALGVPSPWEDAFADLNGTSDICGTEGDAAAHAAARVARSQGQLDNFVRQRFDQFLAEARLAQDQSARESETRVASERSNIQAAEAARLETRRAELAGERSRLLERLTAEHPSVVDVDRQIADLDRQRAAPPPAAPSPDERQLVAPETRMVPPAGWKDLVAHCMVEYDQLAAECRRAERQFEEAQLGHAAAMDTHLAALGRWSEAATSWGKLFASPAALGSALWGIAAIALAVLGWLAARNGTAGTSTAVDRLITSADQIERWFSLPVVAISAAGEPRPAPARRRPAAGWLVLPAQLALALAVFCLVATTIQNPLWLGYLWAR
ncbi:MAG TPA: hypothetical protein VGG30_02270 [Pirellulales bacterium]